LHFCLYFITTYFLLQNLSNILCKPLSLGLIGEHILTSWLCIRRDKYSVNCKIFLALWYLAECLQCIFLYLLDIYVEVNSDLMKPLEEYMLFTKTGSEKVEVTNPLGIRSAQCGVFDLSHKPKLSPSLNISLVSGQSQILKKIKEL
jgi:hypothetical protein